MKGLEDTLTVLKAHYDKLIAFVMLVCLIGSLLYLAFQISRIQRMQKEFDHELNALKPEYPSAQQMDETVFNRARGMIAEPFQVVYGSWTNRQLFVPELRVWCEACRWPIPYDAKVCPFPGCRTEVDPMPGGDVDTDLDGIPDLKEMEYGLNHLDPSDAQKDKDGDGFSNLEEFLAKTDPNDPKLRPELPAKLRIEKVVEQRFMYRFKSQIILPDGTRGFGLNKIVDGRVVATPFKKLGEEIDGFKLEKFEELYEMQKVGGSRVEQKVDVSRLTLKRRDKTVVLVKNKDVQQSEYVVHFLFLVDQGRFEVKTEGVFPLAEEKYRLLQVDIREQSVVIERVQDGKQFVVRRLSE